MTAAGRHATSQPRASSAPVKLLLGAAFYLAIVATFGFILLPVASIFLHIPLSQLVGQLGNVVVTDAIAITFKAVAIAEVAVLIVGTPTAYFLATRRFPGRTVAISLIELPIVLPPAVAGIGLFFAFGERGLLGHTFDVLGIDVKFNLAAVVLAIALVSGPFYVRQGIASFEAVDPNLQSASRTLGASPLKTFFRVTLPLARSGLAAGMALSLARGLGEFGATIMFAGSLQGRTQTLPLAVYTAFESGTQVGLNTALAMSALLVVLSLAILVFLKVGLPWRSNGLQNMTGIERLWTAGSRGSSPG